MKIVASSSDSAVAPDGRIQHPAWWDITTDSLDGAITPGGGSTGADEG
jgi:hypothetical protein